MLPIHRLAGGDQGECHNTNRFLTIRESVRPAHLAGAHELRFIEDSVHRKGQPTAGECQDQNHYDIRPDESGDGRGYHR
jgi:hypothetical protein